MVCRVKQWGNEDKGSVQEEETVKIFRISCPAIRNSLYRFMRSFSYSSPLFRPKTSIYSGLPMLSSLL